MKKKILLILLIITASLFFILEITGWYLGNYNSGAKTVKENTANQKKSSKPKKAKNVSLEDRLRALSPKGLYIVINTSGNRLYLKKGENTILEAVVSCGSGNILTEPSGKKRTWVFDSPRGEYSIKSKIVNPIWVKPDWAFIEEGEEIPQKTEDRMESGMLGDYGLAFGDGYLIHGTLYTRLLGRNVSHGCVRVGDKDLEAVYKQTPIGTKVILF
ncbi:MAG: L,D-transpeptidase [Nitrospirae bacterium]|nr:L,D-transpeptidase [Nitrospirota bacterium]